MRPPAGAGAAREPDWDVLPRAGDKVWAPDLFAWAYEYLVRTDLWRGRASPEELEHDRLVITWRDRVRDGAGWIPPGLVDEVKAQMTSGAHPADVLLRLVVSVDRAYTGISLIRPRYSVELEDLLEEWDQKGTLEKAAPQAVLRKGSYWRLGSALSHYCKNLTWVSESSRIATSSPPRGWWTLSELFNTQRSKNSDPLLTVGFVPALYRDLHMQFEAIDRGHDKLFRTTLNAQRQDELARAAPGLVARLEAAGVNLALLPETTAGPDVADALVSALIDNTQRAIKRGGSPNLRLLALGLLPGPGVNEARVITAEGEVILTQPKLQPWTLDARQKERYGLPKEFNDPRREDLQEQGLVWLLEDPGFGRLVFLICEDLVRSDPARRIVDEASPTVVVSPVLDDSLEKGRWAFKAAELIAAEPGSLVLVANCFVLAEKKRTHAGTRIQDVGIAIVCHPNDWGQTEIIRAAPAAQALEVRRIAWPEVWS